MTPLASRWRSWSAIARKMDRYLADEKCLQNVNPEGASKKTQENMRSSYLRWDEYMFGVEVDRP